MNVDRAANTTEATKFHSPKSVASKSVRTCGTNAPTDITSKSLMLFSSSVCDIFPLGVIDIIMGLSDYFR